MDFFISYGDRWIVANDRDRALERFHQDHPVWTSDVDRINRYKSREAAQRACDKILKLNLIHCGVKRLKDLFTPMYCVTRSTERKNYGMIITYMVWVHKNSNITDEYHQTRDAAQAALDKLKQDIVLEHHDLIMRCRGVELPDPD
jgi:hypothetical protein